MVPLDAKGSNLNKDDKHRNNSSHCLTVISSPPFLAWADAQCCSRADCCSPRAWREPGNRDCCRSQEEPRMSLSCHRCYFQMLVKYSPNISLSLEVFLVSPELHPKLARVYFVPPSSSRVDAAEEKGLVLLPKARCHKASLVGVDVSLKPRRRAGVAALVFRHLAAPYSKGPGE